MFIIDIFKFLLNVFYLPLKLFKTKRKIVFISRQSNTTPLEFKMIIDSLRNEQIEMVTFSKKIEKNFVSLFQNFILLFREMYHIATAKMLIVDGYCIVCSILRHKKSLIIIQTWHGNGIIKKIGLQTLDGRTKMQKKLASKMNMHKNYDFVLSSSKETSKVFLEAFDIKKENLLEFGTPMLDYLYYKKYKIDLTRFKRKNSKPNVLYMPTLRKNKRLDMSDLIKNFNFDKYNLYLKLHPVYELDNIDPRVTVITGCTGEQAFSIADYVITDYSNILFESILVGINTFLYVPDIEEYTDSVGLNINIQKELKKYTFTKIKDLLNIIDKTYDIDFVNNFAKKYVTFSDGKCVERIKDFIIKKIK